MNTRHTPGPWKVSEIRTHATTPQRDRRSSYAGGIGYVWTERPYPQGCCIAKVYEESLGGELEANARLIAAAPDLLKALAAIVNDATEILAGRESMGMDFIHAIVNGKARSAIAKATGEG